MVLLCIHLLFPAFAALFVFLSSVMYLHTDTHPPPKTPKISFCGLKKQKRILVKALFSSSFFFQTNGGAEAKLKTHGTFHLKRQSEMGVGECCGVGRFFKETFGLYLAAAG